MFAAGREQKQTVGRPIDLKAQPELGRSIFERAMEFSEIARTYFDKAVGVQWGDGDKYKCICIVTELPGDDPGYIMGPYTSVEIDMRNVCQAGPVRVRLNFKEGELKDVWIAMISGISASRGWVAQKDAGFPSLTAEQRESRVCIDPILDSEIPAVVSEHLPSVHAALLSGKTTTVESAI